MLVLTHGMPANDAQRRLFRQLHDLGLGAVEFSGVAVLGDGFGRFGPIAGLVCTRDAVAVLAAVELTEGDGYLFAPIDGPWTAGGLPAHLGDAGGNPVPGVDRAVKRVVSQVRLRGLDPGMVQSLIVVDGPVTGVAQPDVERGRGVLVARMDQRSIVDAMRVATSSRDAGLARPWTTADLVNLLEILGFDCAELSTDLLTREGFGYSPYVLRHSSPDDIPFSRPEPVAGASRPLHSHSGGPLSIASVLDGSPAPEDGDRTGPIPAVTPPLRPESGAPQVPHRPLQPAGAPPAGPAALLRDPDDEPERHRSPWRWIAPLVALAVVVGAIWFGWQKLFGTDDAGRPATPQSSASAASARQSGGAGGAEVPADQTVGGLAFSTQQIDSQADCAAHAYGVIKNYLSDHPCTSMKRGLFLTQVDGKPVVIAIAEVTMPDEGAAKGLKTTADTDGTGNVNDLLREGGAPAGMPGKEVLANSAYASAIDGQKVRISLAAFTDGSDPTPGVDSAADSSLKLQLG